MNHELASIEDRTLIRMIREGRSDCFGTLIERHIGAVGVRVASMCVGKLQSEVDDILQDIQIKAWLHLPTFRFESAFRTWLTRIAINEVLQAFRKCKEHSFCALDNLHNLESVCDSPYRTLIRSEEIRAIREAVADLPPKYREPILLFDLQQRSAKETAKSLGIRVNAVKSRLFRARNMLRIRIKEPNVQQVGSLCEKRLVPCVA